MTFYPFSGAMKVPNFRPFTGSAPPPPVAPTVVQTATSNTTTLTFAQPTTVGNTLVVCVGAFNAAAAISGVTIGGSADKWAQAVTPAVQGACVAMMWADFACTVASTTIVVTGTGLTVSNGNGGCTAYEIAGTITAVDKTQTGVSASNANWSSGATATTSKANEIWIGMCEANRALATQDGTFTNVLVGATPVMGSGTKIVTAAGAATYSGTLASADFWAAAIITLEGF